MARCCYPGEYAELFREGEARRTVRRFLRRGLRGSARRLADAVVATGIEGATILEVGGGAGDLLVHLLRSGAARGCNVELSPNWEGAARRLLAGTGLAGRVRRRVGDFVDDAGEVEPADVVVLHRVLCCYPDWQAMLDAAVAKAGRVVAIAVPVGRLRTRAVISVGNALLALRRQRFRAYVHPTGRIIAALEAAGLRVHVDREGLVWHTIVAVRVSSSSEEAG